MDITEAFCAVVAVITLLGAARSQDPNIIGMFPAIMAKERESMQLPCDDNSEKNTFDFIVVGAGVSGCVVANRLTEVEDYNVLLLEAGGKETAIMDIPMLAYIMQGTDASWMYRTSPSERDFYAFTDRKVDYRTGKGVGGGSLINYMISVRGCRQSYDNWERMGNKGWGYNDLLHYFKKLEQILIPELTGSQYHSTKGNVKISYSPHRNKLASLVLQAAKELGYPETDYNGENQTGFSLIQCTVANGSRWSASRGYMQPIRERKNLNLRTGALVTKILFKNNTNIAVGVEYSRGGKMYTAYARKEVILSAGALKSPQLLMLSGIGPQEHLKEHGINVIKNSKVGYNAMDHPTFMGLSFIINETIDEEVKSKIISNTGHMYDYYVNGKGELTGIVGNQVISFMSSEYAPPDYPDLASIYMYPSLIDSPELAGLVGLTDEVQRDYYTPLLKFNSYRPVIYPMRPKSRGRVTLTSTDIKDQPHFVPGILTHEDDILVSISGIKKMIELNNAPSFKRINSTLFKIPVPPCKHLEFGSDEYWRCAVKNMSLPLYHASGTCKMGPSGDESAVVDPELRVHGVEGLRVIDLSIIPDLPSSHPQMVAYMIGEKGADLIKEHYNQSLLMGGFRQKWENFLKNSFGLKM